MRARPLRHLLHRPAGFLRIAEIDIDGQRVLSECLFDQAAISAIAWQNHLRKLQSLL